MAARNNVLDTWPDWVKTDQRGAPKKYEDGFFDKWFDGKFHTIDSSKDFGDKPVKRSSAMSLVRTAAQKKNLKIEVRPHPEKDDKKPESNLFAVHARPYTEDELAWIEKRKADREAKKAEESAAA